MLSLKISVVVGDYPFCPALQGLFDDTRGNTMSVIRETPFQFSIRSLLLTTASVSLLLGLSLAPYYWQAGLIDMVLALAVPAGLAGAALSADSRMRALFVGMAIGTGIPSAAYFEHVIVEMKSVPVTHSVPSRYDFSMRTGLHGAAIWFGALAASWCFAPFAGAAAMLLYRIGAIKRGEAKVSGTVELRRPSPPA